MSLARGYDERELEAALEQSITRFLLELGTGFAFVGRQVEVVVSGKTRRVDMLFYHIRLRCYVVLELKARPFEPGFAGFVMCKYVETLTPDLGNAEYPRK